MDRFLRMTFLAVAGAALVWLAGCGKSGDSAATKPAPQSGIAAEIAKQNAERVAKEQADAQAAAEAEQERIASEAPSAVTKEDFKKGSKITGTGYLGTVVREGRRAGERVHLQNLEYNLKIHAAGNGWPKSHEEFMKLVVDEWGMPLPELAGDYEYWYNAEDHQLYKRPIGQGSIDQGNAAEENTTE